MSRGFSDMYRTIKRALLRHHYDKRVIFYSILMIEAAGSPEC